jgi:dTDP-glucose pyrophosphorylase
MKAIILAGGAGGTRLYPLTLGAKQAVAACL